MKKNILFSVMAMFMLLFAASCSQEEILSANQQKGGEVSLSVNIPVNNPVTRAMPNIPAGYKLRCILQLVDGNNKAIADQKYVSEVPEGSEKVTFTFTAPEGAYKCLLWADYVKTDGGDLATADNIYNTQNLAAGITYTDNAGAEMFNNDAADAFYECSLEQSGKTQQSITLKRPFTRITFASKDEAYADYTKINVTNLPAPTSFNLLNGQTTGNAEIASSEMAISDGKWFSTYLFVGSNQSTLGEGNDITFTLKNDDNSKSTDLKFAGTDIPLTVNNDVKGEATPAAGDQSKVEVTFPGDMIDPNAMAVGDYINKDGSFSKTFNAENAIGIVFALKTAEITDNSNYGDGFTGKTIAGYAMALTSVARTPLAKTGVTVENPNGTTPWEENDYNGYSYSAPLVTAFNALPDDALTKAYATWLGENTITSNNLSSWYIPSGTQLKNICDMIYGAEETALSKSYNNVITAKKGDNKEEYPYYLDAGRYLSGTNWKDNKWNYGTIFLLSSYITEKENPKNNNTVEKHYNIMLTEVTVADESNHECKDISITAINTKDVAFSVSGSFGIRPVLTVFEAAE